jgi:hypothetical protein
MPSDYRPRLSVDITEEHKQKLDRHLGDWGRKKEVVFVILEDLFRLFEKHGAEIVIGALVSRAISLKDICKLNLEE